MSKKIPANESLRIKLGVPLKTKATNFAHDRGMNLSSLIRVALIHYMRICPELSIIRNEDES